MRDGILSCWGADDGFKRGDSYLFDGMGNLLLMGETGTPSFVLTGP